MADLRSALESYVNRLAGMAEGQPRFGTVEQERDDKARRDVYGRVARELREVLAAAEAAPVDLRQVMEHYHRQFCEYDGQENGEAVCAGECREFVEDLGKVPEPAPVADRERVAAEVLREHTIECTALGDVTCRGCHNKRWMSWHAYRQHVVAALSAAGVFHSEAGR